MHEQQLIKDFRAFSTHKPPVRRAAYSDRTAWLMAILSELAYARFDEEDENSILALAAELAQLTDQDVIADKIATLVRQARTTAGGSNELLRSVLSAGGFDLKGVLFDPATDTQGFVATRQANDGQAMAVVSFRGTQQVRDWMTNLQIDKVPVTGRNAEDRRTLGSVHSGFNRAFLSVQNQVLQHLKGAEELPLYVTGHSLGGALATLATWHLSGDQLAACYTFGAPRVGDDGLMNRYRTPIYRIVNGADPVPCVPPSGGAIAVLKVLLRALSELTPLMGRPLDSAVNWLVRKQGFRHYGYQRYLSICEPGDDGTFPKLKNEFGIGSFERLWRYVQRLMRGEVAAKKRIDKYHDIALYRAKLREFAIRRLAEPR